MVQALTRYRAAHPEAVALPPVEMVAAELGLPAQEASRLLSGGHAAKQALIHHNLRLVMARAKKYIHRGVPFLDLVQVGTIGLVRAAELFDPAKGYRFSTYADRWIRSKMLEAIDRTDRIIYLPLKVGERVAKLPETRRTLTQQKGGRPPGDAELAEALGVTVEELRVLRVHEPSVLSLDLPMSVEDESWSLADLIPGPASEPDLRVDTVLAQVGFAPLDIEIIKDWFGFGEGGALTRKESAARLGIKQSTVTSRRNAISERLRTLSPAYKDYLRLHLQ
jgi:RNA polymerase sigma factor (sigma-70 family)